MAKSTPKPQTESVQEEWRAVVGWEGLYEVSSLGRARSLDRTVKVTCGCGQGWITRDVRGKILAASAVHGYPSVQLAADGGVDRQLLHRLVCRAFNGPPPPGKDVVAHNDGDPSNARADNLRWVTTRENTWDTFRHGRLKRGIEAFGAKITDEQVQEIRRNANGDPHEMAQQYGVQPNHIRRVIRGSDRKMPTDSSWTGEWLIKGDRRPRWGLSKKDRDFIVHNPDNMRIVELAAMFGLTDKRIYQIRSAGKENKRPRSTFPQQLKDYIAANPDKLPAAELAARVGVTAKQVYQVRYWAKKP